LLILRRKLKEISLKIKKVNKILLFFLNLFYFSRFIPVRVWFSFNNKIYFYILFYKIKCFFYFIDFNWIEFIIKIIMIKKRVCEWERERERIMKRKSIKWWEKKKVEWKTILVEMKKKNSKSFWTTGLVTLIIIWILFSFHFNPIAVCVCVILFVVRIYIEIYVFI
jgi:hypothetical protein